MTTDDGFEVDFRDMLSARLAGVSVRSGYVEHSIAGGRRRLLRRRLGRVGLASAAAATVGALISLQLGGTPQPDSLTPAASDGARLVPYAFGQPPALFGGRFAPPPAGVQSQLTADAILALAERRGIIKPGAADQFAIDVVLGSFEPLRQESAMGAPQLAYRILAHDVPGVLPAAVGLPGSPGCDFAVYMAADGTDLGGGTACTDQQLAEIQRLEAEHDPASND